MKINNKLVTPLVTIALLALGYVQVANSDGVFTDLEKWQFAALIIGAIVTYIAPITSGPWPAVLKVAGAVVGAALATIVTAVGEGTIFDGNLLTVVLLAALNAFAAQTGTDARIEAVKEGIANPDIPTREVIQLDPKAAKVAIKDLEKTGSTAALWGNSTIGQHRKGS